MKLSNIANIGATKFKLFEVYRLTVNDDSGCFITHYNYEFVGTNGTIYLCFRKDDKIYQIRPEKVVEYLETGFIPERKKVRRK